MYKEYRKRLNIKNPFIYNNLKKKGVFSVKEKKYKFSLSFFAKVVDMCKHETTYFI